MKRCPYCGEEILAVAKKCKHCGEWLKQDSPDASVVQPMQPNEDIIEPCVSSNEVVTGKNKVGILFSLVIPVIFIIIFGVAINIFHKNYTYTDWWIDEEKIIIPCVIAFVVLLTVYYLFIFRKSIFCKRK